MTSWKVITEICLRPRVKYDFHRTSMHKTHNQYIFVNVCLPELRPCLMKSVESKVQLLFTSLKCMAILFKSLNKYGFHCIGFQKTHKSQHYCVKFFYIKCETDLSKNMENMSRN